MYGSQIVDTGNSGNQHLAGDGADVRCVWGTEVVDEQRLYAGNAVPRRQSGDLRGAQKYTQHVLAYQGEEVRQTGETQQLRMTCYGDAIYAFVYGDAQGQPVQTAFSEKDTITLPTSIAPWSVTVQMKPQSAHDGDVLAYSFMKEKTD